MNWSSLTDKGNVDFAKVEYNNIAVGIPVRSDNKKVGYVYSITDNSEGGRTIVVTPNKVDPNTTNLDEVMNVAVLYQGSSEPFKKDDWADDWISNDAPMAANVFFGNKDATPQLEASADSLNAVLQKFPNAAVDVYGHSLGSMDGQFAIVNANDPDRIRNTYLYEGPNIYGTLSKKQQAQADKMKHRVFNFVDQNDMIAMNYKDILRNTQPAVGDVYFVDSKLLLKYGLPNLIDQHMWGGYQYNQDGSIKLLNSSDANIRANKLSAEFFQLDVLAHSDYITNSQRIFLDYAEATILIEQLMTELDGYMTDLEKLYEKGIQLVEENWANTLSLARTAGPHLNEGEIIDALAAGGATESVLVIEPKILISGKKAQVQGIKEKFDSLLNEIKQFIKDSVAKDSEESEMFNNWHTVNGTYEPSKEYAKPEPEPFGKPVVISPQPTFGTSNDTSMVVG